jgi:hypothetical protein
MRYKQLPNETTPSWTGVGLHISLAVEYQLWREAPWLRIVITQSDEQGRPLAYRLTEQPHVEKLESAVEQWLTTGEIPKLEAPACHLLALRFVTVGHILTTLDGFFQPPQESQIDEICRKFLLQWWERHGADFAVGLSCAEYDISA